MKKTIQKKVNFLVLQESRHRFIEDAFNQLVCQLASKGNQPGTECAPQQPREWPKLSLLRSLKQPFTQDQMRYACEVIQSNAISDINAIPKHKYTVIDFKKGSQTWDEQIFTLNNMALGIKVLGGSVTENFDFYKGDRLDAVVYIRSEGRSAEAFLKAKGADAKEYFLELEEFSMLYHTCDQQSGGLPVEDEKVTGEVGIFTLFNRKQNLLFITTY